MIERIWQNITKQYIDWQIDTLIVMPNHIHAILVLDDKPMIASVLSLPQLMRNLMSYTMTCYCHGVYTENWPEFEKRLWQRSYYEHIIRNEDSLQNGN